MYAHRRLYTKQWKHQKDDERYTVEVARGGESVAGIQPERISRVDEEVMYWRKANHIHRWFVDHVQRGTDDCQEYHVSEEHIRELLKTCEEVLKASALVKGDVLVSQSWNDKYQTWDLHREPGRVIKDPSKAKELLPTSAGFFFGHGEYDEYYLDDVIDTRIWLSHMLRDIQNGVPGDIIYSSSW